MKKFLLGAIAVTMLVLPVYSVNANDKPQTTEVKEYKLPIDIQKEIETKLTDKGIEKKVQKKLIKKLERGEIWDSLNEDVIEQVDPNLITASLEEPYKFYTFPDGSFIESSLTKDSGQIGIQASTCGTGYCSYSHHKISKNTTLIDAYFYADFTINYGAADRISKLHSSDYDIDIIGGSYSDDKVEIIRSSEDIYNNLSAKGRLVFTYKINTPLPLKSKVASLYLVVGDDSYYGSSDF